MSSPHTTSSFLSEHLSFENPDHSLAITAASKLYGTINKLQHTETSLGFSSTFNTNNNVVWALSSILNTLLLTIESGHDHETQKATLPWTMLSL